MTNQIRIGVLRGGPSNEYDVSLKSGSAVLDAIKNHLGDKYQARDVFIDKHGIWHMDGVAVSPAGINRRLDAVFNALHGAYGEDGKVQAILETHGIPFTGSGPLGSALGMNKVLSKKIFRDNGIKTPYGKEIPSSLIRSDSDSVVRGLFNSFLMPAIVKPTTGGSSVGMRLARYYDELPAALAEASSHSDSVLIEEFIPGIEATCGVIEGFRGRELYALPPVEIRPSSAFFDYEAKYGGKSEEIVPATFSDKLKRTIEDLAATIHRVLGLRHYSRSDFIIHPRRGVYALEVNTLPGLTEESLFPKSLRAVGSSLPELVEHLICLATGY